MKRVLPFVVALGALASPAAAQDDLLSACGTMQPVFEGVFVGSKQQKERVEDQLRFLCGQVVSAMTTVQPTIGIGFTGGNPVLGTATTMGRRLGLFPRISVTARVNGALAEGPDLLNGFDAQLDPQDSLPPMGTSRVPVGALQGDVAIGLFNGLSLGPVLGGLGAIDLLGSLSFIPAIDQTGLKEDIINWGAGARIGLLRQGLLMPGLSVSAMYRNMSERSFGSLDAGDPAQFATDLSTVSLRAAISKGFLAFDLAAGGGYDIYRSTPEFNFRVVCPAGQCGVTEVTVRPEEPITGELRSAAWNVFANGGLSLLLVNLVGELGYQKPTEVITAADLQEAGLGDRAPADEELGGGRLFGSVGVRFTF